MAKTEIGNDTASSPIFGSPKPRIRLLFYPHCYPAGNMFPAL